MRLDDVVCSYGLTGGDGDCTYLGKAIDQTLTHHYIGYCKNDNPYITSKITFLLHVESQSLIYLYIEVTA